MKILKFKARFFNYNKMHDQFEYVVQCISYNGAYDQPDITPFTVVVSKDFQNFNKISDSLHVASSVEYLVSKITDEKGRKSFAVAFYEAMKEGFENIERAAFDFEISQSLTDSSKFTFVQATTPFVKYTKQVNGSPYTKKFSTDLGAVVADAKFYWINDYLDMGEDVEAATQLNVDQLWDEEDNQTLYYIEFEREGRWYDATTWESGEQAEAYFTPSYSHYAKLIDDLKKDISMLFDSEWESIYTLDGEFLSREQYENRSNNDDE